MAGRLRVGLAGFGSVGQFLARRLDEGALPQVELTAIAARDLGKAAANAADRRFCLEITRDVPQ